MRGKKARGIQCLDVRMTIESADEIFVVDYVGDVTI